MSTVLEVVFFLSPTLNYSQKYLLYPESLPSLAIVFVGHMQFFSLVLKLCKIRFFSEQRGLTLPLPFVHMCDGNVAFSNNQIGLKGRKVVFT